MRPVGAFVFLQEVLVLVLDFGRKVFRFALFYSPFAILQEIYLLSHRSKQLFEKVH